MGYIYTIERRIYCLDVSAMVMSRDGVEDVACRGIHTYKIMFSITILIEKRVARGYSSIRTSSDGYSGKDTRPR